MKRLSHSEREELRKKIAEYHEQKLEEIARDADQRRGDSFKLERAGIRKGVSGGLLMMAIAVIWSVVAWNFGYVFFYTPILFVIGLYAFVKGIVTGNLGGRAEDPSSSEGRGIKVLTAGVVVVLLILAVFYYMRTVRKPAVSDNAVGWNKKGLALAKIGRPDEALKCFDKATEISPNFTTAWSNKGWAMVAVGRYEEAINCCDRAIGIDPDDAVAWDGKGFALLKMGHREEAVKCCDRAIEMNPNLAAAWLHKGMILHGSKQYEEAKRALKKAEELGFPGARQILERLEKHGR